MSDMRETVIERLLGLYHTSIDWSNGYEHARKDLEAKQNKHREYLNTLSDDDLLDMLLREKEEELSREKMNFIGGERF
jgi:hypothetical protein